MERRETYGIGQQDFKMLRESGCVYIDKTRYIADIIASKQQYYFLARPRRFGKSLFLSTLQYFFEGRRELFNGLYVNQINWDWEEHPVLRLDLNADRYAEPGQLDLVMDNLLNRWERKFGIQEKAANLSSRFSNVIAAAHEFTGQPVVILVDEYDKPLVGNLNKDDNFEQYRSKLASLYSNFKSCAEHIRLVFLTGVSRFNKLSVFSDLNNLKDITFTDMYADICGITESELIGNLQEGIERLAANKCISHDDALQALKTNYDGYRFAKRGSDIYNPWSLLNALDESTIANFWNYTGFPSLIAEALKRVDANLENLFESYCSESELRGFDILNPDPKALLYQTGYLTIKEYIPEIASYRLGIPNKEVKAGLYGTLLPYYVKCKSSTPNETVAEIVRSMVFGKPEEAMKAIQAYFAGVNYKLRIDNENNFHNAFFLLMDLIGLDTQAESHTSDGSIDILVKTHQYIYVIELKYDHSAEEALRQIERKSYSRQFQVGHRKVFEIGASFSSKTRCVEDWLIRTLP